MKFNPRLYNISIDFNIEILFYKQVIIIDYLLNLVWFMKIIVDDSYFPCILYLWVGVPLCVCLSADLSALGKCLKRKIENPYACHSIPIECMDPIIR